MGAPKRILIVGGPRTGKTTLAEKIGKALGHAVKRTDDLIGKYPGKDGWSAASAEVSTWMTAEGPWVIEGVATARAARKWLSAHPGDECPVDLVLTLDEPFVTLTARQAGMAKGVTSVWSEVRPELERRGVRMAHGVHALDLAVGDVHTAAAPPKKVPMAEIDTDTRNSLPDGKFADPADRKYPIHDKAHADNAAARLEQQKASLSPSKYSAIKRRITAAQRRFGETPKPGSAAMTKPAVRVQADLQPGERLHVRHFQRRMSDDVRVIDDLGEGTYCLRDVRPMVSGEEVDPSTAGVTLIGPSKWKDGSPVKLVWVQLAETGAWKGHGAGPFEMTSATFSEIVTNFERRGLAVPFDMEHASEQGATSGSIPVLGAPAHGWIHRLDNRGPAGLWGLTEWLDYVRDGIRAGNFAFVSPAIRFGSRDGVTGKDIGARLTSAAVTNSPFLTHLEGLVAARDGGARGAATLTDFQIKGGAKALVAALEAQVVTLKAGGGSAFAHKPHEYMPAVKACLGLHELAPPQHCADRLDELREHVEASGDAEGTHHGVDLGGYTKPMRSLVDAQPGDTWDDVFDAVEGLIQAAIADHEAKFHAGQTPASPPAGLTLDDADAGDMTMSDPNLSQQLSDKTTEVTTLTGKLSAAEGNVTTLTEKLTAAETVVGAVTKAVTLKDKETVAEAVARVVAENTALLADKVKRDEADLNSDVEIAFATYKDTRKLSDADKVHMLSIAKADRKAFNGMYPYVAPDQRHLLRTLTPSETRTPPVDDAEQSPTAIIKRLMNEKGISYAQAQIEAAKVLKK